jgi:hypothetical protein
MERHIYRVMAPNRLPEIDHFPALRALPRERVLSAPRARTQCLA